MINYPHPSDFECLHPDGQHCCIHDTRHHPRCPCVQRDEEETAEAINEQLAEMRAQGYDL